MYAQIAGFSESYEKAVKSPSSSEEVLGAESDEKWMAIEVSGLAGVVVYSIHTYMMRMCM